MINKIQYTILLLVIFIPTMVYSIDNDEKYQKIRFGAVEDTNPRYTISVDNNIWSTEYMYLAKQYNLDVFIVLNSKTPNNSEAVIMINTNTDISTVEELNDYIDGDIESIKENSPDVEITFINEEIIKENIKASKTAFFKSGINNQCVNYIVTEKVGMILVFSVLGDYEEYKEDFDSFIELMEFK